MIKPSSIFKYFNENRIDLFENGLVRFSPPKAFNDPFETFPNFISMAPHEAIDEFFETFDSDPDYYEKIFENCLKNDPKFKTLPSPQKHLMATMVKKEMQENRAEMSKQIRTFARSAVKFQGKHRHIMIETMLNTFNKSFAILCLTEKKDNLLMWAHYANSHKGFVLEFHTEHPFFRQTAEPTIAGHLRKVRYTLEKPKFTFFDDSLPKAQVTQSWVDNLIWVKSEHWAYEEEWRILSTLDRCEKVIAVGENEIHLFAIPFDSIKRIYLGCRMREETKNEFISIIRKKESLKHIDIFQAAPDDTKYELNFSEL